MTILKFSEWEGQYVTVVNKSAKLGRSTVNDNNIMHYYTAYELGRTIYYFLSHTDP